MLTSGTLTCGAGPRGLPLFGHYLAMCRSDRHTKLLKWAAKYGKQGLFQISYMGRPCVVVVEPNLAQQVRRSHDCVGIPIPWSSCRMALCLLQDGMQSLWLCLCFLGSRWSTGMTSAARWLCCCYDHAGAGGSGGGPEEAPRHMQEPVGGQ